MSAGLGLELFFCCLLVGLQYVKVHALPVGSLLMSLSILSLWHLHRAAI